ncbi:hypothetical protein [Paenibacillus marinisediminis]
MNLFLGILLVAFTCVVALVIVGIANSNIRKYDENKHENFLSDTQS